MAANPDEAFISDKAKKITNQFNIAWPGLINELHNAFNSKPPSPEKSIELMFHLKKPAFAHMQIPSIGKSGNAGSTFSFLNNLLHK